MTSQVHDILSTYNHKKKKNKETFWLIYHKGKNINPGMSKVYHHARTRGAREYLQIHFFSLARILSGDCITAWAEGAPTPVHGTHDPLHHPPG